WEELWKDGLTPWCNDRPAPSVEAFVRSNKIQLPTGRYLVPGCGIGHEVYMYASLPQCKEAWGVDISATAMEHANRDLASRNLEHHGRDIGLEKVRFKVVDLFSPAPSSLPIEPFDLVHDYTFLCALPPAMRPAWATRITELTRPGGLLIALAFPLDDHIGGPPYSLNMSIYHDLLDPGFELIYEQVPEESLPGREGKERLTVWRRK
ncbi:S-adenosyl-L-methionine-dependent methyltransferase, partial [Piptocephalis cylindrospora]